MKKFALAAILLCVLMLTAACAVTEGGNAAFSQGEITEASKSGKQISVSERDETAFFENLQKCVWAPYDGAPYADVYNPDTVRVTANVAVDFAFSSEGAFPRTEWVFYIDFYSGYVEADMAERSSFSARCHAEMPGGVMSALKAIFDGGDAEQGKYRLTVVDKENLLFYKPTRQYFNASEQIVFRSHVLNDADLGMFWDGKLYQVQRSVQASSGYIWEFEFCMPDRDVTLEFDIVSYKSFKDMFPQSAGFTAQNTSRVRYEQSYIGVAPGSLKTIVYSFDCDDLAFLTETVFNALVSAAPSYYGITGGYCVQYTFYNGQQEFSFSVQNGNTYANGDYHRYVGSLPGPTEGECRYAFVTYSDKYGVLKNGETLGTFDGLGLFEFSDCVDAEVLPDTGITLKTEFGVIELLSETRFVHDGKDYVLTKGSFDFAFRLAG